MNYIVDFVDWTVRTKNKILKIDFIRFGIIGFIGFTVNYLLLTILFKFLKLEIVFAQIISGEIALLGNFLLHNFWTYKNHEHISYIKKLLNFHITSFSGQLIILTIEFYLVNKIKLNYGIALIIASGVAMFWNYLWTKYYVFKSNK